VDCATFECIRKSTAVYESDPDTGKPHPAEHAQCGHYFGQGSFADNNGFTAAPFNRDGIIIPWCHAEALAHNRRANKGLFGLSVSRFGTQVAYAAPSFYLTWSF
jgi:hypothetical protein